ncbi:MAG: DNA-binding response regulator [Cytophagales bacterium]|nr:MAG: DNA-binding response regulator [Cytophagales bacterium]
MRIRLLLLHSHQLICQSLATYLQPLGYYVQCCTTTLDDALELARTFLPELILADASFDAGHGFEAARMMQVINPRIRLLVSLPPNPDYVHKALQTDASGYLPQQFELPELETCLQTVRDCFRYVSPVFTNLLALPIPTVDPTILTTLNAFSVRRKQVLVLVCRGLTTKDIASRLSMSFETVVSNKKFIATTLGLPTRRAIVFFMASYTQWLAAHAQLVL